MLGTQSKFPFWILRYLLVVCVLGATSLTTVLTKPNQRSVVSKNSGWTTDAGWRELAALNHEQDQHLTAILPIAATQVPACRGRCLNPHPNQYRTWYGQQNGCFVQVWRGWPEGCQHYQWYNSCNGYWDVNPDGSARVYWTCCVH